MIHLDVKLTLPWRNTAPVSGAGMLTTDSLETASSRLLSGRQRTATRIWSLRASALMSALTRASASSSVLPQSTSTVEVVGVGTIITVDRFLVVGVVGVAVAVVAVVVVSGWRDGGGDRCCGGEERDGEAFFVMVGGVALWLVCFGGRAPPVLFLCLGDEGFVVAEAVAPVRSGLRAFSRASMKAFVLTLVSDERRDREPASW